jgi:Glycosyl hydrolases family 32 N-terminal domain
MHNPPSSHVPCWDPWILKDRDIYRLFYLSGRTDQAPWWKTSWICEAQSSDMRQWQHLGPVLQPLNNQGWESGRLFAGSAYKEADNYYLFYSAARESDIATEAIGLATSTNGTDWQRLEHPILTFQPEIPSNLVSNLVSKSVYAGRDIQSSHLHWRDPYVVKDPISQQYYLFFCASVRAAAGEPSFYQGGVGIAMAKPSKGIANHIGGPYQILAPVAGPGVTTADAAAWPFHHLERPQIIYFQGQYHLFFSCFKDFVNPIWLSQIGADRVSDSTLYWYVSNSITGPFEPISSLPVVPGSESTGLYGTTFSPLPVLENWQQIHSASEVKLAVLGWYSNSFRLAIAQEFYGIWNFSSSQSTLKIVAASESSEAR